MRLALGTVQFGVPYGVTNQFGKVSRDEVQSILNFSLINKIDTLDTAIAYGESEKCLGEVGVENFNLVTKLPEIPNNCLNINAWVFDQVEASLSRLRITKLYGLLLHQPYQLLDHFGSHLYQALQMLKEMGLVEKIGISVYSPDDLARIVPQFRFDLVQAPFNLIDQRLYKSGWMRRLKEDEIEIHSRSTFLQGLLLMQQKDMPSKFYRWNHLWQSWHQWLEENNLSALQACLDFSLSFSEVDKVIVGVDSQTQLIQILKSVENHSAVSFPNFASDDQQLINPVNWNTL